MRPSWCPHPDCRHLTGGGSSEDSGMACGGQLPDPEDHNGTPNTHRLCMRTVDGDVTDLQVNRTDVWYLGRIVSSLGKAIGDGVSK